MHVTMRFSFLLWLGANCRNQSQQYRDMTLYKCICINVDDCYLEWWPWIFSSEVTLMGAASHWRDSTAMVMVTFRRMILAFYPILFLTDKF